jgi:hypothetical protein
MGALSGAAVALTTMLTASACLFDGGGQASGEGGPQRQEAKAQAPASTPAAAPEKTLASRDTSSDDSRIRVALTSLAREGSLATLNFTATVLSTSNSTGWQVSDFFGTGEPAGPPPGKTDLVNGVFLIDGTNKKKHLVATDTNRNCVCTGNLSGTFVRQGQSIVLSATFAAPPDNVNAVDVNVPHTGTFRNVPIS